MLAQGEFEQAEQPLQKAEPNFSLAGKGIVIVEDEGLTQIQLQRIAGGAGLKVLGAARNGKLGVDVVLSQQPDIVLMDINMPVMDGLEAARRILESVHTCVILLTAYSDPECRQHAQELKTGGYIVKPVTREALIPQIEDAYRRFYNL